MGKTRIRGKRGPFVVAPASGVRIRTRLHVTAAEGLALRGIGSFLGGLYRTELADRIGLGRLDRRAQAGWRATAKRALTAVTSSRWSGAITRAVEDQYQLGMRGLAQNVSSLDAAIATLEKRCALTPGERDEHGTKGYRDAAQRYAKTRRLAILKQRRAHAHTQLEEARPSVVVGGKRLWRSRNHLDQAELTQSRWREVWDASRMFLTADGETGKRGGNETIRVDPETGTLRIKNPAALVDRFGSHLTITASVVFSHRGSQWRERIANNRAVRYDITDDPQRGRWYLHASWTVPAPPVIPPAAVQQHRVLGVDVNDGHLAMCVVDPSGNAVGEPNTVEVAWQGLPASTRDGHLRAAITELLDRAQAAGSQAIVVEDLNFEDARATGRETQGRGKNGKRFRRSVAGIPTARFRNRLRGMASERGISIIAVNPANTSKAGKKYWREPLQEQTKTSGRDITGHHGASVTIARRGLGHKLSRHSTGPRTAQRSITSQPATLGENGNRVRAVRGTPHSSASPCGRPDRSSRKNRAPVPKTVRGTTEQCTVSLGF